MQPRGSSPPKAVGGSRPWLRPSQVGWWAWLRPSQVGWWKQGVAQAFPLVFPMFPWPYPFGGVPGAPAPAPAPAPEPVPATGQEPFKAVY